MARCSLCGLKIWSPGDADSRCAVCGAPLCEYCALLGKQYCRRHEARHTRQTALLVSYPAPTEQPRHLPESVPVTQMTSPTTPAAQTAETDAGLCGHSAHHQARSGLDGWRIRAFLARFRAALNSLDSLMIDGTGDDYLVWGMTPARRLRRTVASLAQLDPKLVDARNVWGGRGWHLPRRVASVVVACYPCRSQSESGDAIVSLDDVMPFVMELSRRAEQRRHLIYLCLFSPRGWAGAQQQPSGAGGSTMSFPYLKVMLTSDADTDHDHCGDERLSQIDALFPLRSSREMGAELAARIQELARFREGISVEEVLEATGCSRDEAMAAFAHIEEHGTHELMAGDGGPILARRVGKVRSAPPRQV